jgi:hypothetical protein
MLKPLIYQRKKASNQISERSGSENGFQSCQDLIDIGEIREDWRSQSPSAVRAQTQKIKRKIFHPHVESWLGFDSKLNQCSAAVAFPQLVVPGEHWIMGNRTHICWKNEKKVFKTLRVFILTLILLMWRIGWANSIPIYIQQDAMLHSLFISGKCSTCFGWYFHPSSRAHTTVSTASGIYHTVTAICRYRGRVGAGLSVLWVAYATLKSVPTLPR